MPRTKVSKNSKRNRDAANREEKIRLYESNMEAFQFRFDRAEQEYVSEIDSEFNMLLARISKKLLEIKMSEFFELNLNKFEDWVNHNITTTTSNLTLSNSTNGSALCNSTMGPMCQRSTKINPNDEGYLTEDSTTGSTGASTLMAFTSSTSTTGSTLQRNPSQRLLRTPGGPMASARLRRPRRSRSASGDLVPGSAIKAQMSTQRQPSTIQSEHNSRNKLRTPMAARNKAFSADRSVKVGRERSCSPKSPPTAILRWPKPGELVLSKCGSPLVAQVMSDKYANVNIPIRNGVLSLQPKKLGQLNKELIDNIDADTINQIKTLQANLNIIMDIVADKAPK